MKRRTLLLGLGSSAISTGAAFGSGAFSQVTANRTADIVVASDQNGFLGLDGDGANNTSLVTSDFISDSNGELTIQVSKSALNTGTGEGVNVNAQTRIGEGDFGAFLAYDSTASPPITEKGAFEVKNNTDSQRTVSFPDTEVSADTGLVDSAGATLTVEDIVDFKTTRESDGSEVDLVSSAASLSLGADEHALVAIDIDTTAVDPGESMDLTQILANLTFQVDV